MSSRRAPGRGPRPCRPGSCRRPPPRPASRSAHGSPPPTDRGQRAERAQRARARRCRPAAGRGRAAGRAATASVAGPNTPSTGPDVHAEHHQPLLQRGDVVAAHQVTGGEQQDPVAEPPARGVQQPARSASPTTPSASSPRPAGTRARPPRGGRRRAGRRHRGTPRGARTRLGRSSVAQRAHQGARSPRRSGAAAAGVRCGTPQGQPSQSDSSRSSIGFGLAPMIDLTSSPFEYTFSVGIDMTP